MHVPTFSLAMIGHKRSPAKLRWREIRTSGGQNGEQSGACSLFGRAFVWPSECLSRWGRELEASHTVLFTPSLLPLLPPLLTS
jgi:hypothetical protein